MSKKIDAEAFNKVKEQALKQISDAEKLKKAVEWDRDSGENFQIDQDFEERFESAQNLKKEVDKIKEDIERADTASKTLLGIVKKIQEKTTKDLADIKNIRAEIAKLKTTNQVWVIGWFLVVVISAISLIFDAHWRYSDLVWEYHESIGKVEAKIDVKIDKFEELEKKNTEAASCPSSLINTPKKQNIDTLSGTLKDNQ